ncbi:MAG: winged helix-turn-helix transcriptional regulator [Candidatus Thorarchaeota archaeon]
MDSVNRKILWELDADCRQSYEKLSQKLGLTANAIRKRVENLIQDGVIVRFMVVPHNAVLNADFISIIVFTDGTESQEEFIQRMGNHPVVHHVSPIVTNQGGVYHLFGQFVGIDMMSELGQFLNEHENVIEAKQYPVLFPKGEKIELTNIQLRVLACLIENPRITISEISRCSKLSARITRRTINELQEKRAVRYTVRWDINAVDNISFWIIIRWNQKKMTHEGLIDELDNRFPNDYWTSFVVATEPIVFARFVVDDLQRAYQITGEMKTMDFVKTTETLVCYSSSDFQWLGERLLQEMISKVQS